MQFYAPSDTIELTQLTNCGIFLSFCEIDVLSQLAASIFGLLYPIPRARRDYAGTFVDRMPAIFYEFLQTHLTLKETIASACISVIILIYLTSRTYTIHLLS